MGQHIYIYSPSGAVRDKAAFKRGVKRLQALGHEVEVDEAALASYQRFAGDDATRLAAIHRAAASGAGIALISRGGYGIGRILPGIKLKAVAKAIDRGTRFVGISDFTALQMAVLAQTGRTTWAGPALCEGFGVADAADSADGHGPQQASGPDDIMEACFDDMACGVSEGTGWRMPPSRPVNPVARRGRHISLTAIESIAEKSYSAREKSDFVLHDAVLWGGNLTMVCSLLGTPWFPQVKGGVLFLEDVAEHPYRIERMLTQLLHSGVLGRQKAIVLGQFTDYKTVPHDRGFNLTAVVAWLRGQVKVPIITNLPFGHVPTKVLLPVGAKIDLAVEGRDALMVWGHAG